MRTETRNLAAMFVDGMRNEKVRVVNLIKLALTLATEALPSSKFPTFCDLLWHLNLQDASGQRYTFGERYTHRNARNVEGINLGHCRAKGPAGI